MGGARPASGLGSALPALGLGIGKGAMRGGFAPDDVEDEVEDD